MSYGTSTLARLARPHAERAIQSLAAIVDNDREPPDVRLDAACVLLGLVYSRPQRPPREKPVAHVPIRVDWGATK